MLLRGNQNCSTIERQNVKSKYQFDSFVTYSSVITLSLFGAKKEKLKSKCSSSLKLRVIIRISAGVWGTFAPQGLLNSPFLQAWMYLMPID